MFGHRRGQTINSSVNRYYSKAKKIPKIPLLIITLISTYGIVVLYSINSGNFHPWGYNQLIRFACGLCLLLVTAAIPVSFWKKYSYWLYLIGLFLLFCVLMVGERRMGAQRWLNLRIFSFQPSEIMRVFIILVLARYFSNKTTLEIRYTFNVIAPLFLLFIPILFVLWQPDLGTAMLFVFVGVVIFFVCGVQTWKFAIVIVSFLVSMPIVWSFLHDYQKNRILMFFSPEKDPSGAGYHIIQSQIALGSGGFWGKGLMHGSQCQLNFLPEKQTDFVFSALGEELGFVGGSALIILYAILIIYNLSIAMDQKDKFARILVFGLNSMLSFYVFINIAMVCGLAPVVGIPLPFFSYGGSSLLMLMFSQGLIFSCAIEQMKQSKFP